jgi:hypothetical protein
MFFAPKRAALEILDRLLASRILALFFRLKCFRRGFRQWSWSKRYYWGLSPEQSRNRKNKPKRSRNRTKWNTDNSHHKYLPKIPRVFVHEPFTRYCTAPLLLPFSSGQWGQHASNVGSVTGESGSSGGLNWPLVTQWTSPYSWLCLCMHFAEAFVFTVCLCMHFADAYQQGGVRDSAKR